VADHGAQETQSAVDVDHVVVQGLLAGLADGLEGSEVDNAVDVGVGLEDLVKGLLVGDIELGELGLLAGDQLNATKGLIGGVVEVVGDDDLVTGLEESEGGERANVARATAGCC
jgi:hypothetical protein